MGCTKGSTGTWNWLLLAASHWSSTPFVVTEMPLIRTGGTYGVTTSPSLTRKKWFEDGSGMHQVVSTSAVAAGMVGEIVVQLVPCSSAFPCTK